jgi:indolepyruvate ferredoxin oxidoreductase beta subunit
MKYDIIVAGVGGQGVLSISAVIAASALNAGLRVKQSEEHGMAQRGGAVVSHLRLADSTIHSDLVPLGAADLIISMEPLESLRYLEFLAREGKVLSAADPVANFPGYPDVQKTIRALRNLPNAVVVEAAKLSRQAGSGRATNMVMVGAATPSLPIEASFIEEHIREAFERKGSRVLEINLEAYRLGMEAVSCAAA